MTYISTFQSHFTTFTVSSNILKSLIVLHEHSEYEVLPWFEAKKWFYVTQRFKTIILTHVGKNYIIINVK